MKKITIQLFSLALIMAMTISANGQCPSYGAPTSGTEACANVPYYFEIENTACPSTVTFSMSGSWGANPSEQTWTITNVTTGTVVGTGNGGSTSLPVVFGPFDPNDPATAGTSYNIDLADSFGDGLDGGGQIDLLDFNGNVINSISGNYGSSTNLGFATPQEVSSVTATITTSAGPVVRNLVGCGNIFEPFTFNNANFCTTTTENIAWSLVCDQTSAVIESGNMDITVYPSIPTAVSDLVTIAPDAGGCGWEVTPANDCAAAAIGTIFTISPDPATTTYTAGQSGTENFTVTYAGISGGPDCCAVGGPAVPSTFVTPAPTTSAVAQNSPFGGTNNSAYLTTGPAGSGGTAVSGNFTVTVSGYDYPSANRPNTTDAGGACQESVAINTFWTTIYVDGVLVSDEQVNADLGTVTTANAAGAMGTASAGGYEITISFADIQAAGTTFDENSVIEAYVYPNSFNGPSQPCGGAQVNATFSPGSALSNPGEWDAATAEISNVLFEFTELVPGPADCELDSSEAYNCVNACSASSSMTWD